MLTSIDLRGFRSFGEKQTIPLEPLTVVVGPNNSGKTHLVTAANFVHNVVFGFDEAVRVARGHDTVFNRQTRGERELEIAWRTEAGRYCLGARLGSNDRSHWERLTDVKQGHEADNYDLLRAIAGVQGTREMRQHVEARSVLEPMLGVRVVRLSSDAIRAEAEIAKEVSLGLDGRNAAPVLGVWEVTAPDKARQLQEFISRCVPEIDAVKPGPGERPGHQALFFRHRGGQSFAASDVSDGVLMFTALAMHIIDGGRSTPLFIEEPERSIHPRRLREIVNLVRAAVVHQGCQIVLTTHSPVVLDMFRDEPEAIVLLRAGERGTEVRRCTDAPAVMDALRDSLPGELLETGFFDGRWD